MVIKITSIEILYSNPSLIVDFPLVLNICCWNFSHSWLATQHNIKTSANVRNQATPYVQVFHNVWSATCERQTCDFVCVWLTCTLLYWTFFVYVLYCTEHFLHISTYSIVLNILCTSLALRGTLVKEVWVRPNIHK